MMKRRGRTITRSISFKEDLFALMEKRRAGMGLCRSEFIQVVLLPYLITFMRRSRKGRE